MITNEVAKGRVLDRIESAKKLGARKQHDISRSVLKHGDLYALFAPGTRYELHASLSTGMVYFYDDVLRHEERDPKRAAWVAGKVEEIRGTVADHAGLHRVIGG